ncbi:recombinase family protein [Paracoccus beibuensis]|uniref:recombinase family protein n=1 Tax=Paracoccus beibuensis TaxID=547602 RepID=UPI00223E9B26|nr:recombinase family protein [Paracoccus beibuensis]
MTTFGYARVSTPDQNLDAQERDLKAAGCQLVFKEVGSGAKRSRPQLETMLSLAQTDDTIIVTSLDRLGRTLSDLIHLVTDFEKRGINFKSLREQLDTHTPTGRLIFHVFGAIAEFERHMIRERTQRGLAAARANGRTGGRPLLLSPDKLAKAVDLIDNQKLTLSGVARLMDVSEATLRRALKKGRG